MSERDLTPVQLIIADTITKHGRSDLPVHIVAALAEAGYSVVESPKADLDAQQR